MERIERTVFLSYRRTNVPWALAIFQNLTQHGYDVFFDYDGIASGDFVRVILGNINARAHFLILLTPSALERCNDPADWLRREIETALDSQRNIVPLMLEGFDFGTPKIASQLTGTLDALKHYNGLSIPPEYFMEAMVRLRDRYLSIPLSAVLHPASPSAQRIVTEQKAAAEAAPAVREEELTAQQWYERGFAATDVNEALRFYSEAIRLKPDYESAFYFRGSVREKAGDLDGALQDFNEAVRFAPHNALNLVRRACARQSKGDLDGALQDYDEAVRLQPGYANAFYFRAGVREANGDLDGALQDYDEAIRLQPGYANAFYFRAGVRKAKGDLDGALRDYDEAVRLAPDDAANRSTRAGVREAKGDLDGALQDYDEAIRLQAGYANAFYFRAGARKAKGDLDGALRDYDEAVRLAPTTP